MSTLTKTAALLALGALAGCGGPQPTEPVSTAAPAALRWHLSTDALPVGTWGVPLRAEAVEGEWTTWRGNNGRTGTRLAPGIATPQVRWSTRVGIQGYTNTPLVGEDTIYVTSQGTDHNYPDGEDGIYALDPASGAVRWFYHADEDVNGGTLTPSLVIAGTDSGTLLAVSRETGQEVWRAEVPSSIFHGPLFEGGRIYVTASEAIHVFDLDGRPLPTLPTVNPDEWHPRGGLAWSNGVLVRTTEAQGLEAYVDGELVWSRQTTPDNAADCWGYSSETFMPPMFVGGAVVALQPCSLLSEVATLDLRAYDAASGELVWETSVERGGSFNDPYAYDEPYQVGLPWLMNATLYYARITRGEIAGFDLASGEESRQVPLGSCRRRQFPAIVGVPSRGYLARHDGTLVAFVPPTGEVAWQMYLGVQSGVSAGGGVWSSTCSADPYDGTALFATPAIGEDGTVYVGTGEGYLYAVVDPSW